MDACLWVVVGSFIIQQVTALSCIECTHIVWNTTDRERHIRQLGDQDASSSWVGTVDKAFIQKALFNPACKDKDTVWFSKNYPAYAEDVLPIGKTVTEECSAISGQEREKERCNYMHGHVEVDVKTHDKQIKLDVLVRNCGKADSTSKAGDDCVEINTHTDSRRKAYNVAKFFNNIIGFLGHATDVQSFAGTQCLCTSTSCPRPPSLEAEETPNSPSCGISKGTAGGIGAGCFICGAIIGVGVLTIICKKRLAERQI